MRSSIGHHHIPLGPLRQGSLGTGSEEPVGDHGEHRVVQHRRFPNTRAGFTAMVAAVEAWPERRWAVEGARGMGQLLAQRLVGAEEVVVDVPAKLATRVRVYSTGHGRKTDRHDAISIARAAVHARHLVSRDGDRDALKLLTEHRRELVVARTRDRKSVV